MKELFNQIDIDANRQGKLSSRQEQTIKASVDPKTWIWGAGICLALVVLGGGFLTMIGAGNAFGILGPILGLVLLFCLVRWVMMWNLRRKLLSDPVMAADGTVTFKKLDMLDHLRYSPETIDGKRLLPQGLAGLGVMLPPGDYRFYYLPTQNWLLSAEPFSSEGELQQNLIAVLGDVFGFDSGDLGSLRAQVSSGEVKIAEGPINLESVTSTSSTDDTSETLYAKIGDVKFVVPAKAGFALIQELNYRVYYYEKKPTNFLSKIISDLSDTYIAAIEPI
jgi:hypothetical protein